MNIVRQVEIFDNLTDKWVQDIPIDSFDLEIFKNRFPIKYGDTLMYDPYKITTSNMDLFPKIKFEFEKYSYYIACYQADT